MRLGNGEFWLGDCLELMSAIPDGSVDMVLCDLPYGTTACAWDVVIPFDALWAQYRRVAKERAAIVLTAAQPFTASVVASNMGEFRHSWIWNKVRPSNPQLAKLQPLKVHEDVLVFGQKSPTYIPQGLMEIPESDRKVHRPESNSLGHCKRKPYVQTHTGYPKTIQVFNSERGLHPTQKPVALFDYLIRTYTNPGDLVLDNCAGSGTTAVAAEQTGRRWLCIEREPAYYYGAVGRVAALV